jgi:membrane fusion protein (multidrug efflux system)
MRLIWKYMISQPAHKHWISVPAIAALLAAAGCGDDMAGAGAAPPATRVVAAVVSPVQWRDTIEALGTTRANESVTITATVSEIVRKVAFESGDVVSIGDVLVDLSSGAQLAGRGSARGLPGGRAATETQRELADRQLVSASLIDTQRCARARSPAERGARALSDRAITAPFDGVLGLRR